MKMIKRFCLAVVLLLSVGNAFAIDAIYTSWYDDIAVKGFDTVAYFTENAAVEGKKTHTLEWNGATWRFSSAANKALFEADPEKYAPQYGGYCAWAVSQNQTASIEPEQFTIVDGKLYLNYNQEVKEKWLVDTSTNINVGDKNWPGLLAEK
jgi:YHS domain-containing protein